MVIVNRGLTRGDDMATLPRRRRLFAQTLSALQTMLVAAGRPVAGVGLSTVLSVQRTWRRLVWDDEVFTRYHFGPTHPMAPVRLELVTLLARELGLLDAPGVRVVGADPAPDEVLRLVHTEAYVDAVRAASRRRPEVRPGFGLGLTTCRCCGLHEASARVVAGTREVALAVWRGDSEHGVTTWAAAPRDARGGSGFCGPTT